MLLILVKKDPFSLCSFLNVMIESTRGLLVFFDSSSSVALSVLGFPVGVFPNTGSFK